MTPLRHKKRQRGRAVAAPEKETGKPRGARRIASECADLWPMAEYSNTLNED